MSAFYLPLSVAVFLVFLSRITDRLPWRFARWCALALLGQAAALQMIEAGPLMRYQHFKPPGRLLTETPPAVLAIVGLQTLLVAVGLSRRWPAIRRELYRVLRPWQLLGVVLAISVFAATVSHEVPRYLTEVAWAAFVQLLNLATVMLAVWALPDDVLMRWRKRLDAFLDGRRQFRPLKKGDRGGFEGRGRRRKSPLAPFFQRGEQWFPLTAALWVIALAAVLNVYAYERHPHIPDEVAYLTQARFFAAGALTMPAPPVPEAFDFYLMAFSGDRWYVSPPPGWPAVLALGVLLGVPWLVNPVLGGVNVLLAYRLSRELYDAHTARLVVLLLCVSPWYVFLGMSFMTHMFTLTCALVGALAVVRARASGRARWAWLAGASGGVATVIRPLDGLVIGGLLGIWAVGIGGRRLSFTGLAAFAGGAVLAAATVLPYNRHLTGDALRAPIQAYTDEHFHPNANAYGFGPERGMGWAIDPNPGHTPTDALINADLNTFAINVELFGWGSGSLLFVALLLGSLEIRGSDVLMLAALAAVFVAYFFYYFSGGPDFGARYWFLMVLPLVVLSARGIVLLDGALHGRALVAVLVLAASALVNFFPWRAIDKYHHYLNMRPDMRALAERYHFGRSLILVHGDSHPDYTSAATYNPLDVRADAPVYAWDRNPQVRAQVLHAYADRPVWLVDGPTVTGDGFAVVAGPLPAAELAGR